VLTETISKTFTAFAGNQLIAAGDLSSVVFEARAAALADHSLPVLIFDDVTSQLIEVNLQGKPEDLEVRIAQVESSMPPVSEPEAPLQGVRGPGRPKLGVVAREVTLLPRHWDWLATQPGGASVALRKLVEDARRANQGKDRLRAAQEAAYRFMTTMGGNEPGFEEASRALFAGGRSRFERWVERWPTDVAAHARRLAERVWVG
jgi:hypothetical protein